LGLDDGEHSGGEVDGRSGTRSGREDVAAVIASADGNDAATCAETNASRQCGSGEEAKGRVDDVQVSCIWEIKSGKAS
jgi:hypothetical protein